MGAAACYTGRPPPLCVHCLSLRGARSIKEEVLIRPTFFQHYDGVVVDWKYVRDRTEEALEREARWIGLQSLRVVVDLSSGINLYPDLRLVDNAHGEYVESMAAIGELLGKMERLGARDLMLALHRYPENNMTRQQTWASWEASLREIAAQARARHITLHLRLERGRPPEKVGKALELLEHVGAVNLRLAASDAGIPRDRLGLWLLSDREAGAAPVAGVPVVFDAVYGDRDEEYRHRRRLRD